MINHSTRVVRCPTELNPALEMETNVARRRAGGPGRKLSRFLHYPVQHLQGVPRKMAEHLVNDNEFLGDWRDNPKYMPCRDDRLL